MGWLCQCQTWLLSNNTSAMPSGVTNCFNELTPQDFVCRFILMQTRFTKTSSTPSNKQPKKLSHAITEKNS